ncbi:putative Zn-dependent peptidase [Bradyrhizobium sp. i1.15.2]
MISGTPKPGVEFTQIEDAIDKVIADLAQNPALAEDLERVKTQLITQAIYGQDDQARLAEWYGRALTTGLSIDDIRSWPDRIRAVTAEQVREAAQTWLSLAIATLGSAPSFAATKIQRLISPGGIEAWFVQEATVPLIAMEYALRRRRQPGSG